MESYTCNNNVNYVNFVTRKRAVWFSRLQHTEQSIQNRVYEQRAVWFSRLQNRVYEQRLLFGSEYTEQSILKFSVFIFLFFFK